MPWIEPGSATCKSSAFALPLQPMLEIFVLGLRNHIWSDPEACRGGDRDGLMLMKGEWLELRVAGSQMMLDSKGQGKALAIPGRCLDELDMLPRELHCQTHSSWHSFFGAVPVPCVRYFILESKAKKPDSKCCQRMRCCSMQWQHLLTSRRFSLVLNSHLAFHAHIRLQFLPLFWVHT